jgi:HK97 family phage major capsid protein
MANFADVIDRDDVSSLIPEEVQKEIVEGVTEGSAALQLMENTPMKRRQQRIPVLDQLPDAYFVQTQNDLGMIQSTEQKWTNKYLNAEKIAGYVVMPKDVLGDTDYDVWSKVKPQAVKAIGRKLDSAIFFPISDRPSTWDTDIYTAAVAASNTVTAGTSAIDLGEDINQLMATMEADGYDVAGFFARVQAKADLRGLRNAFGNPIFYPGQNGISGMKATPPELWGQPIKFSQAGLTNFATLSGNASMFALADKSEFMLGVREDVEFEIFTQGVVTDASGRVVVNLMTQQAVCMVFTARFGFCVPNPVNSQQTTRASRYPAAVLKQS